VLPPANTVPFNVADVVVMDVAAVATSESDPSGYTVSVVALEVVTAFVPSGYALAEIVNG
jgi:hypothetical protein